MIEVNIPGRRNLRLEHLILDLNGTLSLDGSMIAGVPERIEILRWLINILVFTADTLGRAQALGMSLGVKIHKTIHGDEPTQKRKLVQQLGSESTVTIGNGSNDAAMLTESVLRICVLGPEGTSAEAVASCDLTVPDINTALDLRLKTERLIATLRR